tara:strand:- start:67 stop:255 length:189 start_codon:yes stop_codon:yes gene_type:complete
MLPGVLYSSRAWLAKMVEGLDQVLPPPLIASAAAILADPLNDQAVAASSEAVAPRDFLSKQG